VVINNFGKGRKIRGVFCFRT